MGHAVMGTATGKGERRAVEAAQAAIASPLLEAGAIDGARGILINVTGSSSLKLAEVNEASTIIQSAAHEDANIIFGAVQDEKMKDEVKITVIATGFKTDQPQRRDRSVNPAQAAITASRTASVYQTQTPAPVATKTNGHPAVTTRTTYASRERQSLEAVKESVTGTLEPGDLDVPAFLRKREN
jgi:cell division protein FtsZ